MILGIVLGALSVLFAVPAWVSVARIGWTARRVVAGALAVTLSSLLALTFVSGVASGLLLLERSLLFALVGVTACIASIVIVLKDPRRGQRPTGIIIGSILNTCIWLLLITLH
jgi:hypothetical protein